MLDLHSLVELICTKTTLIAKFMSLKIFKKTSLKQKLTGHMYAGEGTAQQEKQETKKAKHFYFILFFMLIKSQTIKKQRGQLL